MSGSWILPRERSSPATTSATAPISRSAMTCGVSWRNFPMITRWSSGREAASNAATARRASTSAGRTSGRNTPLCRGGLTASDGGGEEAATNTGSDGAATAGFGERTGCRKALARTATQVQRDAAEDGVIRRDVPHGDAEQAEPMLGRDARIDLN